MVEISFENVAPVAALLIVSVTIWGAAKKFTQLDVAVASTQKDIEQIKTDLKELKRDYRDLYEIVLRLQQKVEDKLNSH